MSRGRVWCCSPLLRCFYLAAGWVGVRRPLSGSEGCCTACCPQAGTAGWRRGTGPEHSNTRPSAHDTPVMKQYYHHHHHHLHYYHYYSHQLLCGQVGTTTITLNKKYYVFFSITLNLILTYSTYILYTVYYQLYGPLTAFILYNI